MADKFTCASHSSVTVLNPEGLVSQLSSLRWGVQTSPQSTRQAGCLPGHIPQPRSLGLHLKSPSSPELQVLRAPPQPQTGSLCTRASSQRRCTLLSPWHHCSGTKERKGRKKQTCGLSNCHGCRKWGFSSLLLGKKD